MSVESYSTQPDHIEFLSLYDLFNDDTLTQPTDNTLIQSVNDTLTQANNIGILPSHFDSAMVKFQYQKESKNKSNEYIVHSDSEVNIKDGYGKVIYSQSHETYEGEFKNYMRHGFGKITFANGTYCEGNWVDDMLNKNCKIYYKNGDFYEGETFYDDCSNNFKLISKKSKCKYIRHGTGKKIYASGAVYEGVWNKGDKQHGKMKYDNGDTYYGYFCDNEKNDSDGKMEYNNGDIYNGDFYKDELHGEGTMTYANGDIYKGDFKHNAFHGTGTLTRANGNIEDGSWKNGNYNGNGYVFYANKNVKVMYMDTFSKLKNIAILSVNGSQYVQLLTYEKITDTIKLPFEVVSFDDLFTKINSEIIHNMDITTLCCPISLDVMIEPVITSCDHTFCKTQLEKCNNVCPLCRQRILYYFPDMNMINIYKSHIFIMNNTEISYDDFLIVTKIKSALKLI